MTRTSSPGPHPGPTRRRHHGGARRLIGTARTRLDRNGRPYIYVSIHGGREKFFLIHSRSTRPDREVDYWVSDRSPMAQRPSLGGSGSAAPQAGPSPAASTKTEEPRASLRYRPATAKDISEILDRLEEHPRFGQAFREDPGIRESLAAMGRELAEKLGTPRSEIERSLRARLRPLLGRD